MSERQEHLGTVRSLAEAHDLLIKKHVAAVEIGLSQYVKNASEYVTLVKRERLEDYALVEVETPFEITDEPGYRITRQWRLIKIADIQPAPTWVEDDD